VVAHLQLVPNDPQGPFVEALQRGDTTARARWFDIEVARVQGLVVRLVGPRADLDDLVHDVFVQAFASVQRFRGGGDDLKAWLTGVTVRVVRGQLRKWRVRRLVMPWRTSDDDVEPDAPSADASPAERAAVARTWALLTGLPTDERIAFALRYFQGLELTEVADAMDVSLSTAKRRLHAARERVLAAARVDPLLVEWLPELEP
jgi:RNA polymerase sigma-70 factor (ECF subfamily)